MKKTVIALLLLLLCAVPVPAAEKSFLGQPFPEITAEDTQGNTFTLSEALKDHEAVLLNIWATWCPPCEAEMPYLNEAYKQYGDRVAFIALSDEPDDTVEIIEAYRQEHGIDFPMGRNEDPSLFQYIEADGYPTTVIIDRNGNAVFKHSGSFFSAGEVMRAIEAFLGDDYTETSVLNEIPKESATRAFPVSAVRTIHVENENVKTVCFYEDEEPDPQLAYVVYDDTAHLRLEAGASDNPGTLIFFDQTANSFRELPDLLDPERGVYVCDLPMPEAESEPHYTYICLIDNNLEEDAGFTGIYLIPGDEYIEELKEEMVSWGYPVEWKYEESVPEEESAPQAYILHVIDQNGAPVPGMTVNFCTDTACTMLQADESGTISFDGAPDVYHVQLLKAPEGYSFDSDFEMYTDNAYGEWALRIRKD